MDNYTKESLKSALKTLSMLYENTKSKENHDIIYGLAEGIVALEKRVPKKIEIYDYGKAHCSVCKTDIHGVGKIKYCFHCGQKLNWDR